MSYAVRGNASFATERAERYETAMRICPAARLPEVLFLLAATSAFDLKRTKLIDMGAGSGFVSHFFEGVAQEVLRLDRSAAMLDQAGQGIRIVGDMQHASEAIAAVRPGFQANVIVSLGAFHHTISPESPSSNSSSLKYQPGALLGSVEQCLDIEATRQAQAATVRDWVSLLAPGGHLFLIDVPGYPDRAWDAFWPGRRRHGMNTRAYHQSRAEKAVEFQFDVDPCVFRALLRNHGGADIDPLRCSSTLVERGRVSLADLIASLCLPLDAIPNSAPMIPADWFHQVVDGFSCDRHFAYFPRETELRRYLGMIGLEEVFVGTIPTPWVFHDCEEAAWFVHELFGLGTAWPREDIPRSELYMLLDWLRRYLSFHDRGNSVFLYWQLQYCVARQPE